MQSELEGSSPRVRGAVNKHMKPFRLAGSSPRVRGAETHHASTREAFVIIPARTGSRAPLRDGRRTCRDYPRMCGGQPSSSLAKFLVVGSSPRVRRAAYWW